jgi:cold shock CspA family protein
VRPQKPDGGGRDVFVRISAVEKAGHTREGAKISYELLTNRSGKTMAAAAFAFPDWDIRRRASVPRFSERPNKAASADPWWCEC